MIAVCVGDEENEWSELEVSRETLSMVRELGRGEFGVVMEASAVNLRSNVKVQTVAVKMLKDGNHCPTLALICLVTTYVGVGATAQTIAAFKREAMRLRPLAHTNVVTLLGVCFSASPPLMILEYMALGDLKGVLRTVHGHPGVATTITTAHLLRIVMDAARGLQYLQLKQYVHRDIAARNVLLSRTFQAKIADFGAYVCMQSRLHISCKSLLLISRT